jgi:hypothetical protein
MLTVQDLQFHPAWREERETARDFVRDGSLDQFSAETLAELGEKYLAFASDEPGDVALLRAIQCLKAAAARGLDSAQRQLAWIEQALAVA